MGLKQVGKIVCVRIKTSEKDGLCWIWSRKNAKVEIKKLQSKDFLSRGWSRWEILSIQGLKPGRKIVYAKVWGSSKLEQENKYNIPHLKVSLEAFFFRNYSRKQKSFHLLARELHDECSASIFVEIICFEMKWNHIFFSINNVQFIILQLDKL